jgi:hypothetical protein
MRHALQRCALALALCLVAAGCITTAERAAQRNNERCAARGHQPNTKGFNDCLGQLDNERDARREAGRREMIERSAAPPLNRGQ